MADNFLIQEPNGEWREIRAIDQGDGVLVPVTSVTPTPGLGVLVKSEDGEWITLTAEDVAGAAAVVTTTDSPTTFFNLMQPNGETAAIGLTGAPGAFALCVQEV